MMMMGEYKRYLLTILLATVLCVVGEARHITGGEMIYRYLGPGAVAGSNKYEITLRLYRDCFSDGAQLDASAAITIYAVLGGGSYTQIKDLSVLRDQTLRLNLRSPGPCIDNPPIVCYEVGIYTETVDLPSNSNGYVISYQRCCRIEGISNMGFGSDQSGATYTASIPGTSVASWAPQNSSARFTGRDTVIICEDNAFVYDFGAVDDDGDSLAYTFAEAYVGASQGVPMPDTARRPPYFSVPYSNGFSAVSPLGANVTLDGRTGLITGIAPAAGIYVVTVSVREYRNGILINIHRKDLQIKVASCSVASANLQPEYITCDGFTLTFQNRSNSPLINTYYWDFGLIASSDDTSNLARPTFTFPDTGMYRVRLITNRGQECSDTAYTIAKIYPGFFPGFTNTPGCTNVGIQFTDLTTTQYGVVNTWSWNFGVNELAGDTSILKNPFFTYSKPGTYPVRFVVTNSKGCRDTVQRDIVIRDRPLLVITPDTLMCNIDTLRLTASGEAGTYSWSPNYNISSLSGPTVNVSPQVTTNYFVSLTTVAGCSTSDTVRVRVVTAVSLEAGNDTVICRGDTMQFRPQTDGLRFQWTPGAFLSSDTARNPLAWPQEESTRYFVTARIGKCSATDEFNVRTVPYPQLRVSNDTSICYGDEITLSASGGVFYNWSPLYNISRVNTPSPNVAPLQSTIYTVSVRDTLGCPKPSVDRVIVTVIPPVPAFAGRDTAVVVGQPLKFQATGAEFFEWSPSSYLDDPLKSDPVAVYPLDVGDSIRYRVKVSTKEGCFAYDTIVVKVFKTQPDIFVPTAFTPNNDGLNDLFKAIPVGIARFDYFKVYNRYGQLVFSTTDTQTGWDGRLGGKEQGTNTFVWMVRGTDYTGKVVTKKGTVVLMR